MVQTGPCGPGSAGKRPPMAAPALLRRARRSPRAVSRLGAGRTAAPGSYGKQGSKQCRFRYQRRRGAVSQRLHRSRRALTGRQSLGPAAASARAGCCPCRAGSTPLPYAAPPGLTRMLNLTNHWNAPQSLKTERCPSWRRRGCLQAARPGPRGRCCRAGLHTARNRRP